MTPRDLLDLADELSTDDREAAWRAATHLTYFAAFHSARILLVQAGFRVPDADRAHAYLWLRLQNCGRPEVVQVGVNLQRARNVRNRADYDFIPAFTRGQATAQVNLAETIIDLLEQVIDSPETLAKIAATVRDYERDVLRDATWSAPETV